MIEYFLQDPPTGFYTPSTAESVYWSSSSTCDALEMTYELQRYSCDHSQ